MITDDDLTLLFFDELSDERRVEMTEALAHSEALRERFDALRKDLEQLRQVSTVRAPAAAKVAWHRALSEQVRAPAAQKKRKPKSTWSRPSLWLPATGIALLCIGLFAGSRLSQTNLPMPMPESAIAQAPISPDFSAQNRMGAYVLKASNQLSGIDSVAPAERERLIADIAEQNRLHLQVAKASGDLRLTRLLRSFELSLQALTQTTETDDTFKNRATQLHFELSAINIKLRGNNRAVPQEI